MATGDLAQLADRLFALLATAGATVGAHKVTAGGESASSSPAQADALRKFLDARPAPTQLERERQYQLHHLKADLAGLRSDVRSQG